MRSEKWTAERSIGDIFKSFPEEHTMILGATGTGKSRGLIMPMVRHAIEHKESMIVVDPKGELYAHTGQKAQQDHKVWVLDFRNICQSAGVNVLSYPYKLYTSGNPADVHKAAEIIDNLSHVLYPVRKNSDPYWAQSAKNLFLGLVYTLFNFGEPDCITMENVLNLFNQGEERYGPSSSSLKHFMELLEHENKDDMNFHLSSYLSLSARETKSCIASEMLEGISPFLKSQALRDFLSRDDLPIQDLSDDKPTAIYLILPDESPIYYRLAGIILHSITLHYISLAQNNEDGRLKHKLNICIDELGNIGQAFSNLPFMLSASRSRNIRIYFVLQSLSQLQDIYGSNCDTITSNANITIAFRTNNMQTLSELSKRCGNREFFYKNQLKVEPLITESQLGALGLRQALIMINGREKFIANLKDYNEIYPAGNIVKPPCFVGINTSKTFDLKKHMFEIGRARKEKSIEMLGQFKNPPSHVIRREDSDTIKLAFDDMDVDAMLADIDKKIAEFEKKEKEEEAANAKGPVCPNCGTKNKSHGVCRKCGTIY